MHRNTKNRTLRRNRVESIGLDITNEDWRQTHQGVAFSHDGTLVDGQHRLAAIAVSGKSVLMRVSFDLPEEAIKSIDRDMAPRRLGDIFELEGMEHGRNLASIGRAMVILETRSKADVSGAQIESALGRHRAGVEWVIDFSYRKGMRSIICAAMAYAYPVNPEKLDELARQVSTKIGMSDGSPSHALHTAMETFRAKTDGIVVEMGLKTLRCAEMAIRGKPMAKVFATEEGFKFFASERARIGAV